MSGWQVVELRQTRRRVSSAYGPYTKLGPVDEDGQYGPQTDFALKHATARLGPAKVDEAFALGRSTPSPAMCSETAIPRVWRTGPTPSSARYSAIRRTARRPRSRAGYCKTLNSFGQDLKVDNWIGPKTTEAFNTALRENDADDLTRAFGRGLGLL